MQMMLEEVYPCMLHSKDCKGFEDSEDFEDVEIVSRFRGFRKI